jgi:hypothetical protein
MEERMSDELIDVVRAQKDLVEARERLKDAEQAAIAALCPVKIGDRVQANGYSHTGKPMEIRRIFYQEGCDKIDGRFVSTARFVAHGPVLKKDGTPGLNDGEYRGILGALPKEDA